MGEINFDTIIIFMLGILSIRDMISKNFDIPKDKKWSWIFYNKSEKSQIPPCFKRHEIFNKPSTIDTYSIIDNLLLVASRHIKKFDNGLVHGRFSKEAIPSNYYINTLEAAHDKYEIGIMKAALIKLIQKCGTTNDLDFIISLKSGNDYLARNFAQELEIIHCVKSNIGSKVKAVVINGEENKRQSLSLMYENMDALLDYASKSSEPLNGIIIDCSLSTGAGIKDCVTHFNSMIEEKVITNINKIEHAYVLYAHQHDTDLLFEKACKINRFFDMDEQLRASIFQNIALKTDKNIGIKIVQKEMKDRNLLKIDI